MIPLLLAAALSLPDLAEAASPTVVQVVAFGVGAPDAFGNRWPQSAQGSGMMDIQPGYVLTNHHLVDGADSVYITLGDGRLYLAQVTGSDPVVDLAVLAVPRDAWTRPLPFRDLEALPLRPGEGLAAIGHPFGLEVTVAMGIVSATHRYLDTQTGARWGLVQTDIPINPGLSGGPLFDLEGRVVGMAVGRLSGEGEGMGFAIPIDRIMAWSDRIREGRAFHAALGLQMEELHFPPDQLSPLVPPRILRIVGVAIERGNMFLPGDLLLSIAGLPVASLPVAFETLDTLLPGSRVEVRIWRNGELVVMGVDLWKRIRGSRSL